MQIVGFTLRNTQFWVWDSVSRHIILAVISSRSQNYL